MSEFTISKALKEVREWKEKVREEEESWGKLTTEDTVKRIHEEAEKIKNELGIHLKTVHLPFTEQAKAS